MHNMIDLPTVSIGSVLHFGLHVYVQSMDLAIRSLLILLFYN